MFDLEISGQHEIIADFGDAPMAVTAAMVRSLNRSIASGRTIMTRLIAQDTGLRSREVRDALRVDEATFQRPSARLAAGLKRIPLVKFGARGPQPSRGRGRGVSYRIGGVSKRIAPAFLATMRSGHTGVFVRLAAGQRKSTGAWGPNLPIKELRGPSFGRVFAKHRPAGLARVREQFLKTFGHDLTFRKTGGGFQFSGGADAGAD